MATALVLASCDVASPNAEPVALAFVTQPAGVHNGLPFSTSPTVEVRDAQGTRVLTASPVITIALGNSPWGDTSGLLAGTRSVAAVDGMATFSDLTIKALGSGYTLTASAEGLTSATSAPFDVSPLVVRIGDTLSFPTGLGTGTWVLSGVAGHELNIFLQATGGTRDQSRTLLTHDSAFHTDGDIFLYQRGTSFLRPIIGVATVGPSDDLESRATGRLYFLRDKTYTFDLGGDGIPYRAMFYEIDRRPESGDSMLTPGVVHSADAIEHLGDIDRFRFVAAAGEEYNLFLRSMNGVFWSVLYGLVPDIPGDYPVLVQADGADTLARTATGTFRVPASGSYPVYVYGPSARNIVDRGPYEVLLYKINHAPEQAPATIALGDSVAETIEMLGDVDEYTVGPTATSAELNVVLAHRSATQPDGLVLSITDPHSDQPAPPGYYTARAYGSGLFEVESGGVRQIRVNGSSVGAGYTGPYDLKVYHINREPEVAPATLSIGDTVSQEEMNPVGDIDTFYFDGVIGQHLSLAFQGLGAQQEEGGFALQVRCPDSGRVFAQVSSPTRVGSLNERRIPRMTLPVTGRYSVTIAGVNAGRTVAEQGPYRLALTPVPAAPETAPAAMSAGDSVVTEAIDEPGDVDEFVVSGTPDSSLIVLFQFPSYGSYLSAKVVDDATGQVLRQVQSYGAPESSGMLSFPANGRLRLRVSELDEGCGVGYWPGSFLLTGAYRLVAVPVSRGPETRSAQIVAGDTVTEAINPDGDIDEYRMAASQGEGLLAYLRLPNGAMEGAIVLEIEDPQDTTILASVSSSGATVDLRDIATSTFLVPHDGTYIVRVRGLYPWARSTYQFQVVHP
jgi:hypothetical protein